MYYFRSHNHKIYVNQSVTPVRPKRLWSTVEIVSEDFFFGHQSIGASKHAPETGHQNF